MFIVAGVFFIAAVPLYRNLPQWLSRSSPPPQVEVINQQSGQDYDHGPIQADKALLQGSYQPQLLPHRVIIPSLSIDLPVKPAKVVKNKWEVFEDSAAFGLGSALPGTIGNSVIFAHARQGYFLPLKNIQPEAQVYILTSQSWYTYKVTDIKTVLPTDISVIAPTTDETLTLYTCSGFADSKRLIVTAKRVT